MNMCFHSLLIATQMSRCCWDYVPRATHEAPLRCGDDTLCAEYITRVRWRPAHVSNLFKQGSLSACLSDAASLGADYGSVPFVFTWNSCWPSEHWNWLISSFCGFPLLNVIPPFSLIYHPSPPLTCETAVTRQHIITTSVFSFGASCLTRHLAACRVRKLLHVPSCTLVTCLHLNTE
jgi:hypothetical protein